MRILAVIPARGGSKGVLGKNVAKVGGRPLVARAIHAVRQAGIVDVVAVSTDDPEIGDVAGRWGATVVRRPSELASDEASSEAAVLHALDVLEPSMGPFDVGLLVQCTSPFIDPTDIRGVVGRIAEGCDSSFTAVEFHGFVWEPSLESMEGVNHQAAYRPRRQDRHVEFLETGAAYAFRVDQFRNHRHRFFGRIGIHRVPAIRSLEIDSYDDLRLARLLTAGMRPQLDGPIDAVVFDFDGVLTDNKVMVFDDGREAVMCDRGDGWGLARLVEAGIPVMVLSTEENPVVTARCRKLSLQVTQGVKDKGTALKQWLDERRLDPSRTVFVGNDANDSACLAMVGHPIVPADAHPSVFVHGPIVLSARGGDGAVREVVDLILSASEAATDAGR